MTTKRIILVILGLVAVVSLAEVIMYTVFNRHIHLFHDVDLVKEYPQLTVETVLKEPTRYDETIAVEGNVSEVRKESASLTLAGNSPDLRLTVEYSGSLPVVNDNVVVIGKLRRGLHSDYFLVAQEIELR